jgi:aryl-alcohol dehydrogenase-like predicted oxidoreductase
LYRERYWHQAQLEAVERLRRFFEPRGRSLVSVAVAWVMQQPGITSAIVGASKPEQLDASLVAADVTLDADERAACDAAWYSLPRMPRPSA